MFSASILPLVTAFESLIIIPRLVASGLTSSFATSLFGLQAGVVGAILHFPLIISLSITTAILPNLSYHISRGSGGKVIIERVKNFIVSCFTNHIWYGGDFKRSFRHILH